MREKIEAFAQIARQLEPDSKTFNELLRQSSKYARHFLENLDNFPTYKESADNGIGIYEAPVSDHPIPLEKALKLLWENVTRPGINPASAGHLGYIPGGGIVHSAFADFLAAITNEYAGVFFAGPGAVRMENHILRWLADIVGYPQSAAGNLTSGGSISNLIGIVTAREAHDLKAADFANTVVYLSEQVHHCVNKALRIAGLKECIIRYVPLDEYYRLRTDKLAEMISEDKAAGKNPWLVVASAGTTDTGAIDPLDEIADIAEEHNLWYHIDAAYGGFFVLCEEMKDRLRGMERSDSIALDPHKSLFLPYGSGVFLVRDRQPLLSSHHYMANYMQDIADARDELSPADLSPELTKHFRGLRIWLPLMLLGVAPFRAALSEKRLLAEYFYEEIQKIDGFIVGPYPDLTVITYRYIPPKGDPDEFNRQLVREIHKDGRIFISSTMLDGHFTLRLAVLVFRTHIETIDLTLEIIREKVALLLKQPEWA